MKLKAGMGPHTFNPCLWEADRGLWVPGQPGLNTKDLSQTNKQKIKLNLNMILEISHTFKIWFNKVQPQYRSSK
jgi:hypothetical protein